MEYPIKVKYEYTNNLYKAKKWLKDLPKLFAADFEVCSKWNKKQKKFIKYKLDNYKLSFEEKRVLLQQLTSDGLSHPNLAHISHLSLSFSEDEGKVIICDSEALRSLTMRFLTITESTQLWHNACFDFKHIYYHTNKIPKNYIDTLLLSKSLINNVNTFIGSVKLKDLMGYAYGDWAISKDNFTIEEQWEEYMIRYSAIDACATYKLYQDIQKDLHKE